MFQIIDQKTLDLLFVVVEWNFENWHFESVNLWIGWPVKYSETVRCQNPSHTVTYDSLQKQIVSSFPNSELNSSEKMTEKSALNIFGVFKRIYRDEYQWWVSCYQKSQSKLMEIRKFQFQF